MAIPCFNFARRAIHTALAFFLTAAHLTAATDSSEAKSTENVEMATLLGELLAITPRLHEVSLTTAETEAMVNGLLKGLDAESIPRETKDLYGQARDAMQNQFIAKNRGQDLPSIGEDIARVIGFMTAEFAGVAGFAFTAAEKDALRQSFLEAMESEGMSLALRARLNSLFDYLDEKTATYEIALGEKVDRRERPFFENLRSEHADIQYNEDGLHWLVVDAGVGDPPGPNDRVRVHYEGSRTNGNVFDSSFQRGEPATFSMAGVIPGFAEGLKQIGRGGKVLIYIPAALGYGAHPPPGSSIEPGDTLIFDAEIIDIIRSGS